MSESSLLQSDLDLIYLIDCAVNNKTAEQARISDMQLEKVYALASRHMLSAMLAKALENADFRDERSDRLIAAAMRKAAVFEQELQKVEQKLQLAGVWYVPLKGILLKDVYPSYAMREMADHDILVDPARTTDVQDIMLSLGYTKAKRGSPNHELYTKPPFLNFEMHTSLFCAKPGDNFGAYFGGIHKRLERVEGSKYRFTPEDFYIYLVAHEYKHYSAGGTGLRSLTDTYLYLKHSTLDMAYVEREMDKLGISAFECKNRQLAQRLFTGTALTEADVKALGFIMHSGAFGTVQHRVSNQATRQRGGKLRYILRRVSVPIRKSAPDYAAYANHYPFFYKHRPLLLLLPGYRIMRGLFSGRLFKELKAVKNADGR